MILIFCAFFYALVKSPLLVAILYIFNKLFIAIKLKKKVGKWAENFFTTKKSSKMAQNSPKIGVFTRFSQFFTQIYTKYQARFCPKKWAESGQKVGKSGLKRPYTSENINQILTKVTKAHFQFFKSGQKIRVLDCLTPLLFKYLFSFSELSYTMT